MLNFSLFTPKYRENAAAIWTQTHQISSLLVNGGEMHYCQQFEKSSRFFCTIPKPTKYLWIDQNKCVCDVMKWDRSPLGSLDHDHVWAKSLQNKGNEASFDQVASY